MSSAPRIYYVFSTFAIGGAERRFMELWVYFLKNQQGDYRAIMHPDLLKALQANTTLWEQIVPFQHRITLFDAPAHLPGWKMQRLMYRVLQEKTEPSDIIHCILWFPVMIAGRLRQRMIFSLTESSFRNVNFRGRLMYWLSALRANRTDVLDPQVFRQLRRSLFFRKSSISCTPGSFTDVQLFKPAAKKQQIVFLGRFFYVKQVVRLLSCWPDVVRELTGKGHLMNEWELLLLGYGQEESRLRQLLSEPVYQQLPVILQEALHPEQWLVSSTVFFSLQLNNNYPSKSLLEAMAAGNIPIVTDVGDTRLMVQPEFGYFVPEAFSAADLANALHQILRLSESERAARRDAARNWVVRHFSIESSARYYSNLYSQERIFGHIS